ncbi:MAG: peroxiredoxin-like family protein [Planctomycetota bacterium]
MAQVCAHHSTLRDAGVRLAFVGSGTPTMAQAFRDEAELPADVRLLVDPGLELYQALGFKRGILRVLGPGSVGSAIGAWRDGFRQGRTQGDPWQNGGVVVIQDGVLRYHYVSQRSGDHPSVAELLAAARELGVAREQA